MMSFPESSPLSAWALLLLLVAGTPQPALSQQGSTFEAEFEISRSPSVVVLQYHQDIGMLAKPDPTPLLRIYGDGRYLVHYPSYMKKAGDWEGRISTAELATLVRSVIERRLLEFDARSVKGEIEAAELAAKRAARKAGQPIQLFEVSDKESTRMRVRLERHKPAGVIGVAGGPLDKEIVWWGLRHDLERYPQIRGLRELASLEVQLRDLTEAPGLVRLAREVK